MARSRVSRCIRLIQLLLSNQAYTSFQIAQELRVSSRTVFRDLRLLEDAGIPIRYDERQGGHVVGPAVKLRFSCLTEDDVSLLLLAAQTSPFASDQTLGYRIRQAIRKVIAEIPHPQARETAVLLKSCAVESPPQFVSSSSENVFMQIIKGIRQRRCLRIAYRDTEGTLEKTRLSPYRLICTGRSAQVVGRSSVHRKTCIFDIQAIDEAELLLDSYEPPMRYRRLASIPR